MYNKIFTLFFVLMLFTCISAIAQVDSITAHLTHSWTFEDGTANDYVGNANGKLVGGATIRGGALITSAQGQWMEMPADSIALNTYKEITLEAWYTPAKNANPSFTMLAFFGNTQNNFGVNYYFMTAARQDSVSRTAISCNNTSTPWSAETGVNGPEYDDGKLHHMVSTLTNDSIKLYIDGNLTGAEKLDTNNNISSISSAFAYLAKSGYTGDAQWIGKIHEFNIYNRALDQVEVLSLFNKAEIDAGEKPVLVEAESGERGSNFPVLQNGNVSYVSVATDYINVNYPGDTNRIITYRVTFADSGTYSLFVRVRVGSSGGSDDSFFYGHGFGTKNDTSAGDWAIANGLDNVGFSDSSALVDGPGSLGTGVWKWINITKNYFYSKGDSFVVSLDSLTRTFQIGGRENGLDIDKFAFGKSYLNYTVKDLEKVLPGSIPLPKPDTITAYLGPPLASKQPKFVGNIYSPAQLNNFKAYWNQVTPENEGKWGSVEGTKDVMNWGGLDAAYKLAKDNGFPFMFHVLVWGAQQPAWIDTLQPADQLAQIRQWFQAVADRYPDIDYLQVANEILPGHAPPDGQNGRANYKEALGGNGVTGWDWVVNAFKMAREIFPQKTKLMINDYNIINSTSNTATYLMLIRLLQSENLINAIGEQGHAGQTDATVATMKRNLDSLTTTGLPIFITEFDIHGPSDAIQLQNYQKIFTAFYEHPGVKGITLWGWRAPLYISDAYLINSDGSERPALVWLRNYLDSVNVTVSVNDISETPYEFRLYYNYPNPFNPTTIIRYSIANTSKVTLKIYDVLGREVRILVNEVKSPGQYTTTFNAQDLATGIYVYQINAGSFIATKKLLLLK